MYQHIQRVDLSCTLDTQKISCTNQSIITTHVAALCSKLHHHHLLYSHRRGSRTPTSYSILSHIQSGSMRPASRGGDCVSAWFETHAHTQRDIAVISNTISSSTDAPTSDINRYTTNKQMDNATIYIQPRGDESLHYSKNTHTIYITKRFVRRLKNHLHISQVIAFTTILQCERYPYLQCVFCRLCFW